MDECLSKAINKAHVLILKDRFLVETFADLSTFLVDEDKLEDSDGFLASCQKMIRSAIKAGHFTGLRSLHIHRAMGAKVVKLNYYLDDDELALCAGILQEMFENLTPDFPGLKVPEVFMY